MDRPRPRRPLRGFTLVELLIVIVIVGILIALLVPAIAGAVRTAKNAQVTGEITALAQALEAFKSQYGQYPPSRILLSEDGTYTVPNNGFYGTLQPNRGLIDVVLPELAQRSRRYLQIFFPKLQPPTPQRWHDFNGNNQIDPLIYLEGDECLVFFLGGIPYNSGTSFSTTGFGKDSRFPFVNQQAQSNRTTPFYEFRADRLLDFDGDGMPSYVDTLNGSSNNARPYAYFSAYGNNGYDPNDVNFPGETYRNFNIGYPTRLTSDPATAPQTVGESVSPGPNPYTSGAPFMTGNPPKASFINGISFQIVSSGGDGVFGPGGRFVGSGSGEKLPLDGLPADSRRDEKDNLTNFANGALE